MFALIMSAAAIAAAIAAVVYTKQRSERAAMRFQNEHKEQVELLVEEVKECRDALKVMATSGLPPENWSSPDVRIGLA